MAPAKRLVPALGGLELPAHRCPPALLGIAACLDRWPPLCIGHGVTCNLKGGEFNRALRVFALFGIRVSALRIKSLSFDAAEQKWASGHRAPHDFNAH